MKLKCHYEKCKLNNEMRREESSLVSVYFAKNVIKIEF